MKDTIHYRLSQASILPRTDLREMLRRHIVRRALACMDRADARRAAATASPGALQAYRAAIRAVVRGFYLDLPAGPTAPTPTVTSVSVFVHLGLRIENVDVPHVTGAGGMHRLPAKLGTPAFNN